MQNAEQKFTTALAPLSLPLAAQSDPNLNELRQNKRHFAELLAMAEAIHAQQEARAQKNATDLAANHRTVMEEVSAVRQVMEELQAVMTDAGAARWRLAAETALREGKDHLAALQSMTNDFTAKAEHAWQTLDQTSQHAAGRFQWIARRLTLGVVGGAVLGGLVTALIVSVLSAWYVTGRAPWVSHAEHQRLLTSGHYLERVWPRLSKEERQRLERIVSKP